jgi:hypothetical protein
MSIIDHLIHTCTIERVTVTRAADGSQSESWADHLSGEPCRLMEESERVAMPDRSFQTLRVLKLILRPGKDVTVRDRLKKVAYEDGGEEGPFVILNVIRRRSTSVRFMALDVEKVGGHE